MSPSMAVTSLWLRDEILTQHAISTHQRDARAARRGGARRARVRSTACDHDAPRIARPRDDDQPLRQRATDSSSVPRRCAPVDHGPWRAVAADAVYVVRAVRVVAVRDDAYAQPPPAALDEMSRATNWQPNRPVRSSRCPSQSHARARAAPLAAASERASSAHSNAPAGVGMRCFPALEGAPEATAYCFLVRSE